MHDIKKIDEKKNEEFSNFISTTIQYDSVKNVKLNNKNVNLSLLTYSGSF